MIEHVASAITTASGIKLDPVSSSASWFADTNWHKEDGNGYGGESMLVTVNCCEMQGDSVPNHDDWRSLLDAASDAAKERGLASFAIESGIEGCNGLEKCWRVIAHATDGVQWLSLTIEDRALDTSGDAGREADRLGLPIAAVHLTYGATVVEAGAKDRFAKAMEPFVGLERPEATTSD
ncbi:hypothetical protein [Microbacterium sp. E-13]|uniref:hypothetical protein n=1 Tax=Microbacterium sp. E-13 TaxID=3404048 RepID=UPI003CE8284A